MKEFAVKSLKVQQVQILITEHSIIGEKHNFRQLNNVETVNI